MSIWFHDSANMSGKQDRFVNCNEHMSIIIDSIFLVP